MPLICPHAITINAWMLAYFSIFTSCVLHPMLKSYKGQTNCGITHLTNHYSQQYTMK